MQEYPASIIRIGRHCSVVTESFADPAVDLLLRLAGVHQVCWSAAVLYDARLGRELELIRPEDPTLSLTTLERQSERILSTYHLVRLFRRATVLAFTFLNLFSILLGAMTFAALQSVTVRTAAGLAMSLALLFNVLVYVYFRRRAARRR
ncbi:hypothetical protein [Dactylosporangium sp. NPDC048998]|uniref:hypothetical protein n=1 Tax=Dactylosporangium sp. NPDC048998 TaxID=3363976 RepID=UPI00371C2FE6